MSNENPNPNAATTPAMPKRKLTLAALAGGVITAVFEFVMLGQPIANVVARFFSNLF